MFVILPNLLKTTILLFNIDILSEFNSDVEMSINDPGDIFRSTFVDLILVIKSISHSIFLKLLLKRGWDGKFQFLRLQDAD